MSRSNDSVPIETAIAISDPVVEANHRIANDLAIIAGLIRSEVLGLEAASSPDGRCARRLLQQMSMRIDALARLHRLLVDTSHSGMVELDSYLREIVNAASDSLTNTDQIQIRYTSKGGGLVSARAAAGIGLFVAEAFVNSIKYAHPPGKPGTVRIRCKIDDVNGVLVEIRDDGRKLPEDFSSAQSRGNGTGTRLMRGIACDLGGTLEFIKNDWGYLVRLRLPACTPS